MSIEAMKLALEALEEITNHAEWHDELSFNAFQNADKAITTLRAAIEQAEKQEWVGLTDEEKEDMLKGSKNAYDAIERIEAKLKEKNT